MKQLILSRQVLTTLDINYLEYLLSGTFTMSKFVFGSFSILIDFPYKSVRYLVLRYLKLSLCRPIFSVSSVIFGVFLILYLEHLNEVFEWIILFILVIRMLITALSKVCSEVCSPFFSTSFRQQHVLSYAKTQCKKFRREIPGFERPRKRYLKQRRRCKVWCTQRHHSHVG